MYYYNNSLYHYGIKGMKWGIRRTPEQLGHKPKRVDNSKKDGIIRKVIFGHESTPVRSEPNSIIDRCYKDGTVNTRSFYSDKGIKIKDIHVNDHGNPKHHPYGNKGEHVVEYIWNDDLTLKRKIHRELTDQEREENSDIL